MKLVVDEPGTAQSAAIWRNSDRRMSSRLLYPEARAALAAARRTGRLDGRGLENARAALEQLWPAVECLDVTEEVARRAGNLAEDMALRGYDAVHLATAESVLDQDGLLAAADTRLVAAARTLGLPVARLA